MPRFPKAVGREVLEGHPRLPEWITKEKVNLRDLHTMKVDLRDSHLHTVCEEARCPNRAHCFSHGTATFLLMGDTCTRACGFCAITSGKPNALDPHEPGATAERVASMNLRYAVLTSVNRDDLPDGGAAHFAATVSAIRKRCPQTQVEVLTPDFMGDLDAVAQVVASGPTVFNHNTETVPSLYTTVRPAGRFPRTLAVLKEARTLGRSLFGESFKTKSGLMLGLGETRDELLEVFAALREVEVDILTLGQYLRPTRHQLPVQRYVHPDEFALFQREAEAMGFVNAACGPMVRSSYHADRQAAQAGLA
jgi:lipoic acid synthetase